MSKALALKEARSISLFPSESEWTMLKEQATMLVRSGLLPKAINTPEKAIAIALKGRDLGIPPMHAFAHIFVTDDGKIGTTAELMLSLINRNCTGAVIDYIVSTDKGCEIEAKRPGRKPSRWGFTIQDAQRAGLLNKFNWQKYPPAMLRARAIAIAARAVYPDAIMGMSHLADELGAETDEDGRVLEVAASQAPVAPVEPVVLPKPVSAPLPVSEAPARPKTCRGLWVEILKVQGILGLTDEARDEWLAEKFDNKPTASLTSAQLGEFLDLLEIERGRAGK